MRVWALFVLAGFSVCAAHATPLENYKEAQIALQKHSSGLGYDGSLEGKQALESLWAAGADWTMYYLSGHPSATAETLETAGNNLGIGISGLRLAPSTWLVLLSEEETGVFFILAKKDGDFREVWRVDKDKRDYPRFPALEGWSIAGAATAGGPYREGVGDVRYGPLFGNPIHLPNDTSGHPRFAIDANYGQLAGAAVGSQITIWKWDGRRAAPLYLKGYVRPLEGMQNTFDRRDLHIEERAEYLTAFVTEPEIGHQMNTTIRITNSGVVVRNAVPANPDLDFIDRLLADAIKNRPIDGRMSMDSAKQLRRIVADNGPYTDKFAPLGELMGSGTTTVKNGTWVCFNTDGLGELNFLLREKAGQRFVMALAEKSQPRERSCDLSMP